MEINVINMKEINDVLYLYKCQGKPIVIDDKVTLQKEKVKNIDQNRQNIFKTRLEKYNSRINQIQKQNVINKAKKAEVSLQREKRIKNKLSDLKSQEYQKNLKLIQSIKDKEIKSQKLLAERKHLMLSKNQDLRKKTFSGNKGFLNKSKNQFSEHEEEINDEPLKEENEEECFIHSDQSKSEAIHFQKFDYLRVYLERINKFKKNFGSCEAGRYFLGKTAPIWDSLTQCIYRKSLILSDMTKESEDTTPEAYRKLYEETDNNVTMKSQASRAANKKFWLLETLNMDLDYEISESDVYRALDKAKSLNDESATAFEIMDLVKCILEHEADVSYNVRYVCNGLLRRTAFEHVKRRTNHQILRRSQNTINRLWEKIDSIPKQQLASENRKKLVEPIIYAFTADPSPHGDTAVSVDPAAAYANRVRMAMRDFSKTTCSSGGGGATSMLIDCEDKGYEMPQKNYVEKHVDKQVDRLMGFVGKRLGSNLMKRSFALVRDPPGYQLAANKFLVLARKMTKIVFDMDYTREEQIYVLDVIMSKIACEIAGKCPRGCANPQNMNILIKYLFK